MVTSVDCYNCKRPIQIGRPGCRACGSAIVRPPGLVHRDSGPVTIAVVEHRYAALFPRFVALFIDGFFMLALSWFLFAQLGLFDIEKYRVMMAGEEDPAATVAWMNKTISTMVLASVAASVAYSTVLLSIMGRTLGGFICRVKVVDSFSGGRISPIAALIRSLAANWNSVLSVAAIVTGSYNLAIAANIADPLAPITYIWALWDSQNQTLHDKIAGTVVVQG